MHNPATIAAQLKDLGLVAGMDVLVHSSLRRLGPVDGGADAIIDVLLAAVGREGTLMMSTVSGIVNAGQPVFHVAHTPCDVGVLSNVFRQRPGAIRSLHPVHSIAALGPKAAFYTAGHLECATPWSPDSPYGRLMRNGGWILFLGANFDANTCIHALEIEARVPGLHGEETTVLNVFDYDNALHQIEHHWHAPKISKYPDLEPVVEQAGGLTYGQVGSSMCRLVDAEKLRTTLLPVFQKTPELGVIALSESSFVWLP